MPDGSLSAIRAKELESKIGAVVTILKHHGEVGRNIEEIVRQTLREYVPQKFGIETGFVRSLEDSNWESSQIDLLLTRQDTGHPLAVFPGTKVFPIESVIGFIEVTKVLNRQKLEDDFKKVKDLKHRVKRHYTLPRNIARMMGILPKVENQSEEEILKDRITRVGIQSMDCEPRFFYFAFSTEWKKTKTICENIASVGRKYQTHLHGMLILDTGYFKHTPTSDPKTAYEISYVTDVPSAFIMFMHDLIDALQTFTIVPEQATVPLSEYNLVKARYQKWKAK